jgi:hypothetical protein
MGLLEQSLRSRRVDWQINARATLNKRRGPATSALGLFCFEHLNPQTLKVDPLGGHFSSSPVVCNDNVYVASLDGKCYVFRASYIDGYEEVAENGLERDCYASHAIGGSKICFRIGIICLRSLVSDQCSVFKTIPSRIEAVPSVIYQAARRKLSSKYWMQFSEDGMRF